MVEAIKTKGEALAVILEVAKAFDKVWHGVLFLMLPPCIQPPYVSCEILFPRTIKLQNTISGTPDGLRHGCLQEKNLPTPFWKAGNASMTPLSHHMQVRAEGSSFGASWQHGAWLGTGGALLLAAENEVLARPGPPARRAPPLRLSVGGAPGRVYNGVSDWLYQEEVTKAPSAIWGSPDGALVMYAQYDDSDVGELRLPWLSDSGSEGLTRSGMLLANINTTAPGMYPDQRTVRFPTPGTPIPKVKLWIVAVENSTTPTRWEVKPPPTLEGIIMLRGTTGRPKTTSNQGPTGTLEPVTDRRRRNSAEQRQLRVEKKKKICAIEYYLISAQWVGKNNSQIGVVWMNRAQNLTVYGTCTTGNWSCVEDHSEKATEEPWLEVHQQPVYSEDGSSFLLLAAVQEGGGQYYTHIKHVDVQRRRMAVLSHGKVEVAQILSWDQENHLVYYLGSAERPGQRHVYVVRDPGYGGGSNSVRARAEREEPRCLTCEHAVWPARLHYANCTFWRAVFAPPIPGQGVTHYVLECGGPGPPLAGLHNAKTHKLERILYDTRPYRSVRLRELALPSRRSFDVQLGSGSRARVQLLLPPSWREELRDAAFPVLVHVDGRPGGQQVTDEFMVDWGTYMSSRNDVVYVKLDVAGARGLPRALLRGRLGGVEVADQLAVIRQVHNAILGRMRYLLDTFKFLDKTRVAVWGWGYGGYVTSMLLGSQQQATLTCGIAVSPITDWHYYNAAFTERILGQPSVNYKGYVEADATQRAHHVRPHALYLLHGLADLSAPYPHALALARALSDAGVLFRYQVYADEGHDLKGVIEHVYLSMEDFLNKCLHLDPEETKLPPPDR
ncbi:Inactive dipeptidyl peptidase 10 [Eumeta japonica]|uniref:Inactive dipeptidyl peptidase 10 n=1 Tax=Eumeta variegata TaxID=151549 RepID=A0A4C1U9Y7_EUMVA|nr:Inactive dipeptidyl peptidase 10 [Eumeta japonica]